MYDRSQPRLNWIRQSFKLLSWSLIPVALLARPAVSAERLYVSYGALERSISVAALEAFVRKGELDSDLFVYSQYADAKRLADLRQALVVRADLTPIAVSQFLYTPQGEILLRRLGQVIQPESRDTGFYAIRAALILASSDPEGLTPLNVFRKFPTRGLRIDLQRSLQIAGELEQAVSRTNQATATINQLAQLEALASPIATTTPLPDLASRGAFSWQKQTIRLVDRTRSFVTALGRDRVFPVDVYLPQIRTERQAPKIPVVIISHGLGSDRTTFRYLAEHLASHGFAVAVPEHPGSNAAQLQALVAGTVGEAAAPSEFVDRPLDIKYLLDDLTRRAKSDPRYGRLNLEQVGVLGQSFGGYTVLALAGAPINFEQLQKDCGTQALDNTLNLSVLLQCRANALPPLNYGLQDSRVKAIFAINPIDSAVIGQAGFNQISIPTMIVSGNADTVAPALPEQVQPFTWLQSPDRYLALLDRGTHFSTLEETTTNDSIPLPPEVVGPAPEVARRYMNALSLAFFETYIANQPNYRPYLSASYAQFISQDPLPLSLVRSLNVDQLTK
ncbi:alpha/beta hydrolase [Phormidesmis priestleyi ULC007]|uniref:Alpha/beta hydrolase n=1 Tax=Phormidesmis priestleyi ULC007 TaxID=1920490 RepID=A0A2T1DDQ8_9CYAN|nr:alpha/beta hydrolase [Phormidesmis priestleyi]PSB18652.1 alpha/beta hydrolase [Phormidesmis priestleyi ULC007]PZO51587.1 MAG: alpha/beta hydrolase [Phormidesmis priestleyi]